MCLRQCQFAEVVKP